MVKRFKTFDPQLVVVEQLEGSAIALTNEAKLSLYKKSQKSGISTDILETVYVRGYRIWNESFGQTAEQFAFDRVNSFVAGGFAAQLDDDLLEDASGRKVPNCVPVEEVFSDDYMKQGREYLKLKRAKEKAAKNPQPKITSSDSDDLVKQFLAKGGSIKKVEEQKKVHKSKHFKNNETSELQSNNPNDPDSRFDGTTAGKNVYMKATPGQIVKKVVREHRINTIRNSRDDI